MSRKVNQHDAATAPQSNGCAGHVLVADDARGVREFVREALAPLGFRVSTAENGEEALAVCRRDAPQVVVTDLTMAPVSGRDLILALKEECPVTVPVVLTGHGTVERTVDLMRLGAFDVLTKPCGVEEIAATVEKALEHHVALQANADLRERLRVQDRLAMIGKLAAGVAHELNNPLDAVLRCVRLTRSRTNGDAEAREYLDIAEAGLQRMADIVQSLLTFSRHATLEQSPQALESLVEETITSITLALGDAAPRIVSALQPAVARLPVPRGLGQILTNLLRNAYDAAGADEPIRIAARRGETELVVEVADRGPGIPAEIRDRVFEPFFTTKDPGRGTGLGLPISARMAEKFGGALRLDCPAGGGTVVTVSLPLPRTVPPSPPLEAK